MADFSAFPNTVSTSALGAYNWSNPTDVMAYDGHYASVNGGVGGSGYSYYIDCTNFGFSIPTGATILGIRITNGWIDSSVTPAYTKDYRCYIIKGGTPGTVNRATGHVLGHSLVPGVIEQTQYGSSTDLWGLSWTAANINASNFGVRQAVQLVSTGGTAIANIDYVIVTVFYTDAGVSVAVTGRSATCAKGTLSRSGSASTALTGLGVGANRTVPPGTGIATVSLTGRSSSTGKGEMLASSPGAGMFLWTWSYGVDANWHEVLGSLIPESGGFAAGVDAAVSTGTVVAGSDAQVQLTGLEATTDIGSHVGYSYAEVFITGLGVTSSIQDVSPVAHGDVNVSVVGRYVTASIGTLVAAGTSLSFRSGVWLLYPVTILVDQMWQCDVGVSEVSNV